MSDEKKVFEIILNITKEQTYIDEFPKGYENLPFVDLGMDSLDKLLMFIEVEKRFSICFQEIEVEKIKNFNELVSLILIKKSKK